MVSIARFFTPIIFITISTISFLACSQKETFKPTKAPAKGSNENKQQVDLTKGLERHLYLEAVEGEKALAWVKKENGRTKTEFLKQSQFDPIFQDIKKILYDKEKIAFPLLMGNQVYNFWEDEKNKRGLLRRTSVESFNSGNPNWEIVLDVDKLGKDENESWVFKRTHCLEPHFEICMLQLSRGGKDASVYREFNLKTKKFVENGFVVPEAKSDVMWVDKDTLVVGTDWGKGTLTNSGYPMQLKIWQRGTPLTQSKLIHKGKKEYVATSVVKNLRDGKILFSDSKTFFTAQYFVYDTTNKSKKRLPLPDSARFVQQYKDQLLFVLRDDWKVGSANYLKGSLLAIASKPLPTNKKDLRIKKLFVPSQYSSFRMVSVVGEKLLLTINDKVTTTVYLLSQDKAGNWLRDKLDLPKFGSASVLGGSKYSDSTYLTFANWITPTLLFYWNAKSGVLAKPVKVKQAKKWFETKNFMVEQKWAPSKDGTKIPYFIVRDKDLKYDGSNPTLLYGYGGFEISLTPWYSATTGKAWLERGGVFVVANIRGGGEFGPRWHKAALKENRQNAYDDFIGVAKHLIQNRVTSPKHLGIYGGSNGGLLVGAVAVQRPELFSAVWCSVPLLDMLRFHKLLAGASWIGEYGNPDIPKERVFLKKISPYHNLRRDGKYPPIYFFTSTKDDRVHPGHARKMAALMQDMGHPFYYYENLEGGHGGSAALDQAALNSALGYAYLWKQLK